MTLPMKIELLGRMFDGYFTDLVEKTYAGNGVLSEAVRYVLAGKGKRVRATLCLLSAELFGKDPRVALSGATALEMIHAYSLVHDDLPIMDNDDWRRGRPTAHQVFGDANALLAGDALLTDAFMVLASGGDPVTSMLTNTEGRLAAIRCLAKAAGGSGMVEGQAFDLFWTGKTSASEAALNEIHLKKTGYLIGASCAVGGYLAGADETSAKALWNFGLKIGHAFQVIDDLLDDLEGTGKTKGKDLASGKLTYLKFMNKAEAKRLSEKLTEDALASLHSIPGDTSSLTSYAEMLLSRQN